MLSWFPVRTLKVKCPTWAHVATFYERKLRPDKTLTLRVPFETRVGAGVMLGLQLPDGTVMAIEGKVRDVAPGADGRKGSITLHLHGLGDGVLERLRTLVAASRSSEANVTVDETPRRQRSDAGRKPRSRPPSAIQPAPPPVAGGASADVAPPVAVPGDAPISEIIEQPSDIALGQDIDRAFGQAFSQAQGSAFNEPNRPSGPASAGGSPSARPRGQSSDRNADEIARPDDAGRPSGPEREVYRKLESELGNFRELAAHEVLGVPVEADVDEVRRAYFTCTKRYHPDLYARHRSAAVMGIAREVFIHINRAYDRMRSSLVNAGRAVAAGPALLSHEGWFAGLDDMVGDDDQDEMSYDVVAVTESETSSGSVEAAVLAAAAAADAMGDVRQEVSALIARGDYESARSQVADALHADPRNRQMRALYYLVAGKQALAEGDRVLAASQFDSALAHDRECHDARAALNELRSSSDDFSLPRFLR